MESNKPLTPDLVLFTIVDDSLGKDVENLYHANRLDVNYTMQGKGAASPEILKALGFGENKKIILVSLMRKHSLKKILFALGIVMNMNEEGRGIAFAVPISSLHTKTADIRWLQSGQDMPEGIENQYGGDDTHVLIVTFLYVHSFEDIMKAARSAGATGGTAISAINSHIDKHALFPHNKNHPGKDVILILVSKEIRKSVMDKISKLTEEDIANNESCIAFPVYSAIGLAHIAIHD